MRRFLPISFLPLLFPPPLATAAPTMIRLGYTNCVACHLTPQGGGLLTPYGRGIDEAQSLFGRVLPDDETSRSAPERRIVQDLRLLGQATFGSTSGAPVARLHYRTSAWLTPKSRVSLDAALEGATVPSRPPVPYSPAPSLRTPVIVSKALFEHRFKEGIELAVGRDALPTGIDISDRGAFFRSRNEGGPRNFVQQAKLFWWTDELLAIPYVFVPGGQERDGFGLSGAGMLVEHTVWNKRTVAGVSGRTGQSTHVHEKLAAVHTRVGLGKWGVLFAYDVTWREANGLTGPITDARFTQYAAYSQVFFAPYEWMVTSLAAERLSVEAPFAERRTRFTPEVSLRVNTHFTVVLSGRDYASAPTAGSLAFSVQVFMKTGNDIFLPKRHSIPAAGQSQAMRSAP